MKLNSNDRVIAGGFITILTATILFSIVVSMLNYAYNPIISSLNSYIDTGSLTLGTASTFEFMINIHIILPIVFLIGIAIYGYGRALGSKSDAGDFFESVVILLFFVFLGTILAFGFGLSFDMIITALDESSIIEVTGLWDSSWFRNLIVSIFHLFIKILPVIGIARFLVTPVLDLFYIREEKQFSEQDISYEGSDFTGGFE